jgi:hypothetical protein
MLGRACRKGRGTLATYEALSGTEVDDDPSLLVLVDPDDPMRGFEPDRLDAALSAHDVRPGDPLWDAAERFVYRIFRVSGFCEESPREYVEETEPWRADSQLHVITEGQEIVGVARTILGTFEELPVRQFDTDVPIPSGTLCEIGSLAVRPTLRGLGVANELHRRSFLRGLHEGIEGICCLIDDWMFDFFRSHYGLPVRALGPARSFMGGEVVPTGMWVPEMLHVLYRTRPNVYRWTVEDLHPDVFVRYDLPIILD